MVAILYRPKIHTRALVKAAIPEINGIKLESGIVVSVSKDDH
jgi:hypothetical protein